MFDFQTETVLPVPALGTGARAKRTFDVCVAVVLLLPLTLCALVLLVANPFANQGPLVFRQQRMGRDCRPFSVIKFRSMRPPVDARGAFDALEVDRITPLGHFMRRTRIDELPQVINVLRGEMSLIGPRPDSFEHACVYLRDVPGYRARHRILPGISGYAQTELGYIDDIAAVHRKVAADLYYIANASFRLDMWIAWRTVMVVLSRSGA